ncbi:MAG: hypothetical protein LBK25_03885 [Treponema sp.]|nr:hypothetical protein [Treponema sp.]
MLASGAYSVIEGGRAYALWVSDIFVIVVIRQARLFNDFIQGIVRKSKTL